MVLWCYAAEQRDKILASTSRNIHSLGGQVSATVLTRQQTDILEIAETGWYKWLYYRDSESSFPYPVECLGVCLDPCEHKVTVMSQHILNDQWNVLPYQTFQRLTKDKHQSAAELLKQENFNLIIRSKLGDSMTPPPQPIPLDDPELRTPESIPYAESFTDFDEYINAKLMLARNEEVMVAAILIKRSIGPDGNAVGLSTITIFLTQVYMISCLWTGRFNS